MSSSVPKSPERLNVLFITADQWRGSALSLKNHPVVRTPNIDRLAREGVTFDNHFTQCVPCGPSRSSLHAGTASVLSFGWCSGDRASGFLSGAGCSEQEGGGEAVY